MFIAKMIKVRIRSWMDRTWCYY